MATANPTQLYEKVSEEEALSRNDQLDGQMIYHVSQEEALSRNARQYGYARYPQVAYPTMPRIGCELKCQWSYFAQRNICDWWCPRM